MCACVCVVPSTSIAETRESILRICVTERNILLLWKEQKRMPDRLTVTEDLNYCTAIDSYFLIKIHLIEEPISGFCQSPFIHFRAQSTDNLSFVSF